MQVLEEVKEDIANIIKSTGVVIHTQIQVRHVKFSHRNLKSILYNLLTNAIKFHVPGRIPEVFISTFKQNNNIVLQVKDNGMGIANEKRKNIFTMFSRLNVTIEGTGIGLYIIKRIIENSGGKIEVESEVGEGSVFSVYFPQE
jgi:signal transduction histidine kinase